jgi:TolA-binding protein
MASIAARIDSLETKLATLGDRLLSTQGSVDQLLANTKASPSAVHEHPAQAAGAAAGAPASPRDPEAGFATDEAIQAFRKASISWQAAKFADAVLGFSRFLERYPDHPLAGTAQYYVGNAYFQQKEYKLALQEYSRVLTSYDRSAHVSDTLAEMARAEDALKNPEAAARHRQLLTSLFPQSPAAAFVASAETTKSAGTAAPEPKAAAPAKVETPAASPLPTAPLPSAPSSNEPSEAPAE